MPAKIRTIKIAVNPPPALQPAVLKTLAAASALACCALSPAQAVEAGRTLIYANQLPASACVALTENPSLGAENFVQVLQEGKIIEAAVSLGDNEICASGLVHGQSYELVLKAGLPAAGSQLAEDYKSAVTIPAAHEQLSFKAGSRLPLSAHPFIELFSTNLTAADLYLYALSLRDLSSLNLNLLLQDNLQTYQAIDLIQHHGSLIAHEKLSLKREADAVVTTRVDLSQLIDRKKLTSSAESSSAAPFEGLVLALVKDPTLNLNLPGDDKSVQSDLYALHQTDKAFAVKLINLSDLMLTAYEGDNLYLSVRSLRSAQPSEDITLTLLSKANRILGTAVTDKQGAAAFPQEAMLGEGADQPMAVLAQSADGDAALLPLSGGALNLTEAEVTPAVTGPLMVYASTGRGIYRPGESVNLQVLVRDLKGSASSAPVSVKIFGPQGQELFTKLLAGNQLGTYFVSFPLSQAAARGQYRAEFTQGEHYLKTLRFETADFVPATLSLKTSAATAGLEDFLQRLKKTALSAGAAAEAFTPGQLLRAGTDNAVTLQADFNYGAAAADLPVTGNMTLTPDRKPLPGFADYHFGPAQSSADLLPLDFTQPERTDQNGAAGFKFKAPQLPYPAIVRLNAEIVDLNAESAAISSAFKLINPDVNAGLIGIRQLPDSTLDVVFKNTAGENLSGQLNYTVYQRLTNYQYVLEYGQWQYRRQELKRPLLSGLLQADHGKSTLPLSLGDGSYVIEVNSADHQAQTSFEFALGQRFALDREGPDELDLFVSAAHAPAPTAAPAAAVSFKQGDEVRLTFESPFSGTGSLILAQQSVLEEIPFEVQEGTNTVGFKFKDEYAPGVKALVSLYAAHEKLPAGMLRAVGIASISADSAAREIKLTADLPEKILRPEEDVSFTIDGHTDQPYYLMGYIVDEGILSLTNYKFSSPFEEFFSPHALSLTVRDTYQSLIDTSAPYSQGYGADAEVMALAKALAALQSIPRDLIAAALPPVLINGEKSGIPGSLKASDAADDQGKLKAQLTALPSGKAQVSLQLPQFNGRLKVLLLAASAEGAGAFTGDLQLRDRAVVTAALPRFMRAGDELTAQVSVRNLEIGAAPDDQSAQSAAGTPTFKVTVSCSGALKCQTQQELSPALGRTQAVSFKLSALQAQEDRAHPFGPGRVEVQVQSADQAAGEGKAFAFKDVYTLEVLPPYPEVLVSALNYLQPGQSREVQLPVKLASVQAAATELSVLPGINVPLQLNKLSSLQLYSVTDQALQALALSKAGSSYNEQVQQIADTLTFAQRGDGLWSDYGGDGPLYPSALVTQALCDLKAQGFAVSDSVLQRALQALERSGRSGSDAAQALTLLTELKYSEASRSNLYYLAAAPTTQSVQSFLYLSACFAAAGDSAQQQEMLLKAAAALQELAQVRADLDALPAAAADNSERSRLLQRLQELAPTETGTLVHDGYMFLALCPASGSDKLAAAREQVLQLMAAQLRPEGYYCAAELAAMLQAAAAVSPDFTASAAEEFIEHDGLPPYKAVNQSSEPRYALTSAFGLPADAPKALSQGLKLNKTLFTLEGKELKPPYQLKINDRVLVRLQGTLQTAAQGSAVLRDLIPSGFILESASQVKSETAQKLCSKGISWPVSENLGEAEYVGVFSLYPGSEVCRLYLLRAAYPGNAALPPASLQLLKAPEVRAGSSAVKNGFNIN